MESYKEYSLFTTESNQKSNKDSWKISKYLENK